jgi:hypothetical protein
MSTANPSIEQVFCLSSNKVFTVFKKGVIFGACPCAFTEENECSAPDAHEETRPEQRAGLAQSAVGRIRPS